MSGETMQLARIVGVGILVLSLSAGLLFAAPGNPQGPKVKLEAPEITCTLVVDDELGNLVEVTWVDNPEAAGYQVQSACTLANITSVVVTEPPALVGVPDGCETFQARVRGLPGPKKEGRPLQGSGPKGEWSEVCVVEIPVAE
jgi:hypothetical protein